MKETHFLIKLNLKVVLLLSSTQFQVKAFNCENELKIKIDPLQCCQLPELYPQETVRECTNLYAENTKKEMETRLPGPKRGDVSIKISKHFKCLI